MERLRSAPDGRAGELETRTRRLIVLGLTRTLQLLIEQISELEREIAKALEGVSEEPCKADRKDWSCLHLLPLIKIRIVV